MAKVTIADQTKALPEISKEWIISTVNKNRVMNKENSVEINIDSENAKLDLFVNCSKAGKAKASNDLESRIKFLWEDLVLSKDDLDPSALYDFLKRIDRWVSFVPKG